MAQDERNDIKLDRGDGPSGPRLPDRRPRFSLWIYLAIFLALLIQIFLFWKNVDDASIDYSTFLDYVEQGYVESVKIVNDRRIEGTYTEEAVEKNLVKVAEPQQDLLGGTTQQNLFTSTKPADNDLVAFLREYNEEAEAAEGRPVEFRVEYEENWFGGLLTWIIPLALIIALWVFLIRRMNPGSQVLNIGKNKAVLFDAMGEQRLTFKDVAGLEEA
ncbi:MAG: ATP-dependent metallopeptidase FtsH/Yme1/Tma family protein, partial [Rhodothermales bacterium]|nr:ATP-dependent metallopeptidase FtsH/Yme1/Tma family protein [Rhodothermales bacterium]